MTAALSNPALSDLEVLLGDWDMALSGASFLPDPETVVHGRIEARPIEEGRLLTLRQHADPSGQPAATWVIGRDEAADGYCVLYGDGRGVSRRYEMTLSEGTWRMWRDDPSFSQRFEASVRSDRSQIVGTWQKRSAGGDWEHDFDVTYTRT